MKMIPRVSLGGKKSRSSSSGEPGDTGEAEPAGDAELADDATAVVEGTPLDLSANEAPPAPPPAVPGAIAPPTFDARDGKPKAGFTTAASGLQMFDGDGASFELRIGPDYKKNGKKAPSKAHTYAPMTFDVFKRKSICFHIASKLTLPPPPDGADTPNTAILRDRIYRSGLSGDTAMQVRRRRGLPRPVRLRAAVPYERSRRVWRSAREAAAHSPRVTPARAANADTAAAPPPDVDAIGLADEAGVLALIPPDACEFTP